MRVVFYLSFLLLIVTFEAKGQPGKCWYSFEYELIDTAKNINISSKKQIVDGCHKHFSEFTKKADYYDSVKVTRQVEISLEHVRLDKISFAIVNNKYYLHSDKYYKMDLKFLEKIKGFLPEYLFQEISSKLQGENKKQDTK